MIADAVVIIIILLCIFLGYKKGLIKVAVRLLSFIAALVVALILYTPISNHIIENTDIIPNLKNTIQTKIYNKEEKEEEPVENKSITETMQSYVENYTEGVKENTSSYISEQIAITIVRLGTWIGLFAVTKLLLIFIRLFTDWVAEIPIIKQFNKTGGIIYGILEGFAITYILLAMLSLTAPMLGENNIYKEINNSHLCKAMYENNLLLKIIL